jgi:beta-glucuronidase
MTIDKSQGDTAYAMILDEGYARPFATPLLTGEDWFFTGGRQGLSLAGDWAFTTDLHDSGLRQHWYRMEPMPPEARALPYDWDPFNTDWTMPVPSCWQMQEERLFYFEGACWYARHFDRAALPAGDRHVLRIGAAAYECKVFLNGRYLGRHLGASTPFAVDISAALRDGDNHLVLCIDNRRSATRVPMNHTDWFNYGGPYREVEIFATPAAHVRDLFVHLVPDGSFRRIRVLTELAGSGTARLEIPGLGIDAVLTPGADGRAEAVFDAAPDLWSPSSPTLYDVALSFGQDRVTDRVGFREIRRRGRDIVLNGKPVFLRGISVHEDDETQGKCFDPADLRRRLAHARDLGCNYLRLAHYPHHEAAAKLADEIGLMLWEEVPVYWAIAFDNPATLDDARNQLTELVRRDRNRASVIIWSVGNENPDSDARLAFMTTLVDTARALDPTRLVSAACLVNHVRFRIEDRLAAVIDVIGINEYFGWYFPDYEELIAIGRNSDPDRPVVISETGADGVKAGGPGSGFFSEDYMTEVYRRQIDILGRLDYIRGMSPWILYDFRAEKRMNRYQRGWNRKGLIAQDKSTKKDAFHVLAAWYRDLAARECA